MAIGTMVYEHIEGGVGMRLSDEALFRELLRRGGFTVEDITDIEAILARAAQDGSEGNTARQGEETP